ncbi:MAG: hypothetical protein K5643_08955 [Saccharofermentans sp.]|nr:hypothetical protein [Saccharofermentans sp.]
MNKIICEKCGAIMEPIDSDCACGMTCPKCGWGWASTPFNAMDEDGTIYDIILLEGNSNSEDIIKTISQITGQNSLNARKTIENAPVKLLTGKAETVDKVIRNLEAKSIIFKTEPTFPH